jgi:hypothetical protein
LTPVLYGFGILYAGAAVVLFLGTSLPLALGLLVASVLLFAFGRLLDLLQEIVQHLAVLRRVLVAGPEQHAREAAEAAPLRSLPDEKPARREERRSGGGR